jgi:hypothetical protein
LLNCFANIPHIYKFFLNGDYLNFVDYNHCFGAPAHKFADYIRVYWNRTKKQIKSVDVLEKEFESGFKLVILAIVWFISLKTQNLCVHFNYKI